MARKDMPEPPSAGPVEALDEIPDPGTQDSEATDVQTGEELKPQGPLSELQEKLRALLDYDQITEVRLALGAREGEIEKHIKKANDLGVREEDARRRLRLIRGSDTRFGLLRIFAPEETTYSETRDLFFDQESPNGRPTIKITFRTQDGEEVTLTSEQLGLGERLVEVRELYAAGMLPADVEQSLRDGGFWHLIEDGWDEGPPAADAEGAERVASAAGH